MSDPKLLAKINARRGVDWDRYINWLLGMLTLAIGFGGGLAIGLKADEVSEEAAMFTLMYRACTQWHVVDSIAGTDTLSHLENYGGRE